MKSHYLVIDGNNPWVQSLTECFPGPDCIVRRFRIYQAVNYFKSVPKNFTDLLRWKRVKNNVEERHFLVPGFTRFHDLTIRMIHRYLRSYFAKYGEPDAVFFTNPFYSALVRPNATYRQAYIAHDVFRFYGWDAELTASTEARMLQNVDATFVVAKALMEDFRPLTDKPLYYSPMAIRRSHWDLVAHRQLECPAELQGVPRPIVGCTGQISASYDWALTRRLASAFPNATFVFVGPIFAEPEEVAAPMKAVFALPNVRHIPAQPHDKLPNFWQHFDVCFNPLAVNEHSDRRSPLRLFDYLATDKPILSTPIREAFEHLPHIAIGRDPEESIATLRTMLAGSYPVDVAARREYLAGNTWDMRAATLLSQLFAGPASSKDVPDSMGGNRARQD